MVKYSKVDVKLTDTQLKNLKTTVIDKSRTILRWSLKMFHKNELLLRTKPKTKLRNEFSNNMSTGLKLKI